MGNKGKEYQTEVVPVLEVVLLEVSRKYSKMVLVMDLSMQ